MKESWNGYGVWACLINKDFWLFVQMIWFSPIYLLPCSRKQETKSRFGGIKNKKINKNGYDSGWKNLWSLKKL